jgi:predicted pyridoxine 5'-phosphate oxidase superfamily flavin-nucleotide-binding protein
LALMHGAAEPFRTVHATYRMWRHRERMREAFRADAEEQQRPDAWVSTIHAVISSDPGPAETEEAVRIWRDRPRLREEHHGGHRDGCYGVTDGALWWFWGINAWAQ